jgi:hypothetical protein
LRRLLVLVPLAWPLLLAAAPTPAHAEQTLDSRPTCSGMVVRGTEFPDRTVLLMLRDVRSGKVLIGPVARTTRPDGSFSAWLRVDLRGTQTVDVSAWRKAGTTVIMTARQVVARPCRLADPPSTLARTGPSHLVAWLLVGCCLLGVGVVARRATRYRGRHLASSTTLAAGLRGRLRLPVAWRPPGAPPAPVGPEPPAEAAAAELEAASDPAGRSGGGWPEGRWASADRVDAGPA